MKCNHTSCNHSSWDVPLVCLLQTCFISCCMWSILRVCKYECLPNSLLKQEYWHITSLMIKICPKTEPLMMKVAQTHQLRGSGTTMCVACQLLVTNVHKSSSPAKRTTMSRRLLLRFYVFQGEHWVRWSVCAWSYRYTCTALRFYRIKARDDLNLTVNHCTFVQCAFFHVITLLTPSKKSCMISFD